MAVFPAVTGYMDGPEQKLRADVLNKPIVQLKERTDYLLERLEELAGSGQFESVRFAGVAVDSDDPPADYDVVCLDTARMRYVKAVSSAICDAAYPYASAGQRSFAAGVMTSRRPGGTGTVVAYGRLDLSGVPLAGLLEPGEIFRNGPYYASSAHPGKITASPQGPAVYIGMFAEDPSRMGYGAEALLAPQLKDLSEAHLHRSFVLSGKPAGTPVAEAGRLRVAGYKADGHGDEATAPVRLKVSGSWPYTESRSYTIKYETASGSMDDAVIKWCTSDGADDSFPGFDDQRSPSFDPDYGWWVGVPVRNYFQPVAIGSRGVYVTLEPGIPMAGLASADLRALPAQLADASLRTWTLAMPEAGRGWMEAGVSCLSMVCSPVAQTPEVSMLVFGRHTNPEGSGSVRLAMEALADGDLSSPVMFRVSVNGVISGSVAVKMAGPATKLTPSGPWVMATLPQGVSRLVRAGDVWTASWSDPSPGADYSYAIGMDTPLAAYYPPEPLSGVSLELNGVALAARGEYGAGVGEYRASADTVRWHGAAEDTAPWPSGAGASRNFKMRFNTGAVAPYGFVTSIRPAPDSGVVLRDCRTGEEAATGDLEISARLVVESEAGREPGALVFKRVNAKGRLVSGPVVERLVAGSGITLSSADPSMPGQGVVRVGLEGQGLTSGAFDDITLLNAKQELAPGNAYMSYYKLLPWSTSPGARNVPSGLVAKMRVPYGLSGQYQVLFYLTMFGLEPGAGDYTQFAGLSASWCVVPDLEATLAAGVKRASLLSDLVSKSNFPVDVPLGSDDGAYSAYDLMLAHTDPDMAPMPGQVSGALFPPVPYSGAESSPVPLPVNAGDVVTLRLQRSAPSQAVATSRAYQGAVGIVDMKWKLTSF